MADNREQLPLIPDGALPERPDLVQAVKSYRHTGTTVAKDQELAVAIAEDLVQGLGQRYIARKYGISRNTISGIVHVLEERGELEPLKKRLSRKLGMVVELATEECIESISQGKVPANVLPVMLGVAADKKAMVDGEPGLVVEHRHSVEGGAEAFRARLEEMKRARVIDAQSTGLPAIP